MSFEEKSTWIYLLIALVIPAYYFVDVLGQIGETAIDEIAYVGPMVAAIVLAVVAAIVLNIIIAIASPRDADKRDERDRSISRFGESVGGVVISIGAACALVLVMVELDYFWIANVLYGSFIIQAITSSVVKIVAYRRGI